MTIMRSDIRSRVVLAWRSASVSRAGTIRGGAAAFIRRGCVGSSRRQVPGASAGSGVEAALEVELRDVLAVSRDHALAPISNAQQESGDDEASLATALRISRRDARFERLLKLAAVAPRP